MGRIAKRFGAGRSTRSLFQRISSPCVIRNPQSWFHLRCAFAILQDMVRKSTSGIVTGAPAMSGHVNLWETPLPLVQFTGAVSTVIMPQSGDVPLSIAYVGGARVYALYAKRAQANLGFMIGGSNGGVNIVPSFALRFSDLPVWGKRLAIGFEVRSPMTVDAGPLPVRWRLWGAFSFILETLDESKNDRVHAAQPNRGTFDLVRSPPQAAPPTQTSWEMTL